jgi:hypothetical protein
MALDGVRQAPLEDTSDASQTAPVRDQGDADMSTPGAAVATVGEYEHVFPTGFKLASILAGVTVSYYLLFLDLAIISTATPAITSEFDSLTDIGWYSGAYQLASAAFQPLSGKIYRYFPLKAGESGLPVPESWCFAWASSRAVVLPRLLLRL